MIALAVLIVGLGAFAGQGSALATASATPANVPVPSSGAYLGVFSSLPGMSDSQSVAYREQQLGRTFDIDSHYYDWTDNFPGQRESDDVAAGRIPEDTWWGTSYASILNGSYDALIRARAEAVKAFGHPLFIRWAAEMNGYWFAWGGPQNGDDPAGFVAAWRHIHDIFTSVGATNVSWVWAPNSESNPGGDDLTSWNNWRNYYPGNDYVDWVGIDGYNWGDHFNGVDEWQSLGSIMSAICADYAGRKPIMIAETSSVESGGSKSGWIRDAEAWIKQHEAIKALVFFDHTYPDEDWAVDSSQASAAAFADLAHDPYFATRRSPAGTTTTGKSTTVELPTTVKRSPNRRTHKPAIEIPLGVPVVGDTVTLTLPSGITADSQMRVQWQVSRPAAHHMRTGMPPRRRVWIVVAANGTKLKLDRSLLGRRLRALVAIGGRTLVSLKTEPVVKRAAVRPRVSAAQGKPRIGATVQAQLPKLLRRAVNSVRFSWQVRLPHRRGGRTGDDWAAIGGGRAELRLPSRVAGHRVRAVALVVRGKTRRSIASRPIGPVP